MEEIEEMMEEAYIVYEYAKLNIDLSRHHGVYITMTCSEIPGEFIITWGG